MQKSKFKPVIPSLREKKRYLVFEVISKSKENFKQVSDTINNAILSFLGQLGVGKAGINILEDKWNYDKQRGVIRVNNKNIDALKTSLMFVKDDMIVRSLGVSGILKKAENKYMN